MEHSTYPSYLSSIPRFLSPQGRAEDFQISVVLIFFATPNFVPLVVALMKLRCSARKFWCGAKKFMLIVKAQAIR